MNFTARLTGMPLLFPILFGISPIAAHEQETPAFVSKGRIAFASDTGLTVARLDGEERTQIEAKDVGEPHESTGGIWPLAFSPDGMKLAVRVWKGGSRIYILEDGLRTQTQV